MAFAPRNIHAKNEDFIKTERRNFILSLESAMSFFVCSLRLRLQKYDHREWYVFFLLLASGEMRFRDTAELVKGTRARPNASGAFFLSFPCSVYTANCDCVAET